MSFSRAHFSILTLPMTAAKYRVLLWRTSGTYSNASP